MNVEKGRGAMGLLVAIMLAGCSGRATVALSATTFHYEEGYSRALLNGQWAGSGGSSVPLGDVGGGAMICCVRLERNAKSALVQVRQGGEKYFEVEARVESPWPESPNYLAIHLLPGRDVVIELSTLQSSPRLDLWEKSVRRHGRRMVPALSPHMWNAGPVTCPRC
ncbi:hypothetical protein GCM10028795_24030 [Lysobacter olei]